LHLTPADVERLLQDPSSDARATTAAKVAHQFNRPELTEQEREIAESIVRVMMRDAESRVRTALSEHLSENPEVPHDIALKLAEDVGEVASPMLAMSDVLTEADLLRVVRSKSADHQIAVARRKAVSPVVADALVDSKNEDVVTTLMANEGADIAEPTFHKVIDTFGDNERVNRSMIERSRIPISVAEQLVNIVSDSLREHLVTHHELPTDVAADLVLQSRERATVSLLNGGTGPMDSIELVEHLHQNRRLTPTIILRALCTGDLDFFEAAMARMASIPISSAHVLIQDHGKAGFDRLYEKCDLPPHLFSFFRVAVDVAMETEYDGGPDDRERYKSRMIERVLTHFEDDFDSESVDYLIAKLSHEQAGQAAVV
jgi:uncharacterized protein (DUF2336 family)